MHWQDKSVPFDEMASGPTPNTFINRQRDRTVNGEVGLLRQIVDRDLLPVEQSHTDTRRAVVSNITRNSHTGFIILAL